MKKYHKLSQYDYEKLFTSCIILLDVFTTTINNTLLECISSNTPIILNKNNEFIEILGENYPLFFNDYDDLYNLLDEDKILEAYLYIKRMDKSKFQINYFLNELQLNIDKI